MTLYHNDCHDHFVDVSKQAWSTRHPNTTASTTAGPGIAARHSSRRIAIGNLDNDGSMEIVVMNLFEPPSLPKNFGDRGNSLLIRAVTATGRDAIGARVTVKSALGT